MKVLKISIVALFIASCSNKDARLQRVVDLAKEQYKGSVSASWIKNENGVDDILLELTDTLNKGQLNNMQGIADQIGRSIYYGMDSAGRTKVKSVKMIFMDESKVYARQEVVFTEFFKYDSTQESLCNMLPNRVVGSGMSVKITEISKTEFYGLAPKGIQEIQSYPRYRHSDSLEQILNSAFRDKFERVGNCYSFRGKEKKGFCRKENPQESKDYEYYNLITKSDDYFIFEVTRYEDGEYWIFNSSNGNVFTFPGYPQFSQRKKYVYGSGGGMYETEISVYDTDQNAGVLIQWPDSNWSVTESYFLNEEGVRLKLKSGVCKKKEKYIDLHFN